MSISNCPEKAGQVAFVGARVTVATATDSKGPFVAAVKVVSDARINCSSWWCISLSLDLC